MILVRHLFITCRPFVLGVPEIVGEVRGVLPAIRIGEGAHGEPLLGHHVAFGDRRSHGVCVRAVTLAVLRAPSVKSLVTITI